MSNKTMGSACDFLAPAPVLLFCLATSGIAGEKEQTFSYPGGVTLQTKLDEMTDEKTCTIVTPKFGVYVGVYGGPAVTIWTAADDVNVKRSPEPLLRIGDAPAFKLTVPDRPHMIQVPDAKVNAVLNALYARERLRLRFWEWPSGNPNDVELKHGDFGRAYDRARQLCGWKALTATYAPPSKEPRIFNGDDGYTTAQFGGEISEGWTVTYMPKFKSCAISMGSTPRVFEAKGGKPDNVLPLHTITFRDANGTVVGSVEHKSFGPTPFAEFLAAAEKAGEYGSVTAKFGSKSGSLFGFVEAVQWAEKTCGISIRHAGEQRDEMK